MPTLNIRQPRRAGDLFRQVGQTISEIGAMQGKREMQALEFDTKMKLQDQVNILIGIK